MPKLTLALSGSPELVAMLNELGQDYSVEAVLKSQAFEILKDVYELDASWGMGDNSSDETALTPKGMNTLLYMIPMLKIVHLDLSSNKLNLVNDDAIVGLCTSKTLSTLNFNSNKLDAALVVRIAEALSQSNITALDIGGSTLKQSDAISFAQAITKSNTLSALSMRCTFSAEDEHVIKIAEALSQSNITALDISLNHLSVYAEKIAEIFTKSKNLTVVDMEYHKLISGQSKSAVKQLSTSYSYEELLVMKEMIEYFDNFVCSAGPYGTPADPLKEMIGADPGLEFFV